MSWFTLPGAAGAAPAAWKVAGYYILHAGGEPPPLETAVQYLLAANGLFKRAGCPYFEAVVPVVIFRAPLPGLAAVAPGVRLAMPRLPAAWLDWALQAARLVCQGGRRELMLQVVVRGRRACLELPAQQASAVHLAFRQADGGDRLCDLHSHHELAPCFSTIDDRDEGGLRFYAVVGRIFTRPTMLLRLGVYGHWLVLPAAALFRSAGPFEDAYREGGWEGGYGAAAA